MGCYTFKWTGPVKILPKGELESNLVQIYRYRDIPILTTMDPPPLGSWMRIHMMSLGRTWHSSEGLAL